MRTPLVRTSFLAIALAVGLSACGNPDVTRQDLLTMLTDRGGENPGDITDEQADCIADIIFEENAFTQDELNKAAVDPDHEDVPGFQPAVDAAIVECGIGGSR